MLLEMNTNEYYNHIEYVVPEDSEVVFRILPETREVYLKLLDGVADIYENDKETPLQLLQDFCLHFWECLCPRLKTKSGCSFLIRGNHYVSSAKQYGFGEKNLFKVSPGENSYTFVLAKDIQLQVFPIKSIKQESSVTISISSGSPEISGYKLSPEKTYHLSPFSPVLLESSDKKPYSVSIESLFRKARLFMRDEKHHTCMNDIKDRIFTSYFLQKEFKHFNPTVLVLGPESAGKTSFCHLLVNEALEKEITPIYVDLNFTRNLSVPGSLSLSKIETRVDSTLDFKYRFQKLLHFGSKAYDPVFSSYYRFLIRKMGRLLSHYLDFNSIENTLSIIDTDKYQVSNKFSIDFVLKAFTVDFIVYIGDEHHYEELKKSGLEIMPSMFIPKPRNVQKPTEAYELNYYQNTIRKYFFGSTSPSSRTLAFHQFTMCRIFPTVSVTREILEKSCIKIEPVEFSPDMNPQILNRLFGVSAARRAVLLGITEVKYYVYFTDIDMTAKTATIMVPESENFNGGILLFGFVPSFGHIEIRKLFLPVF